MNWILEIKFLRVPFQVQLTKLILKDNLTSTFIKFSNDISFDLLYPSSEIWF